MNENELKLLVERYMDGETTLEEEERLQSYFLEHENVDGELASARQLVLGLASLRVPQETTKPATPPKKRSKMAVYVRRTIGIAASLLLLAGLALTYDRSQNYSEAIVYGHPTNDRELIRKEVSGTIDQLNDQTPVEHQLRDVLLGAE